MQYCARRYTQMVEFCLTSSRMVETFFFGVGANGRNFFFWCWRGVANVLDLPTNVFGEAKYRIPCEGTLLRVF